MSCRFPWVAFGASVVLGNGLLTAGCALDSEGVAAFPASTGADAGNDVSSGGANPGGGGGAGGNAGSGGDGGSGGTPTEDCLDRVDNDMDNRVDYADSDSSDGYFYLHTWTFAGAEPTPIPCPEGSAPGAAIPCR
jgi:hypothetical protein